MAFKLLRFTEKDIVTVSVKERDLALLLVLGSGLTTLGACPYVLSL